MNQLWTIKIPVHVCGWRLPVGACRAELGIVALSRGTVLVSGSGVLLVGEVGAGLGTSLGFLCTSIYTQRP